MYVYVVESQESETGDAGNIHAIFTTEAAAEACAEDLRAEWRRDQLRVYEDLVANGGAGEDWDVSAVVTKTEVLSALPDEELGPE
jgi:hypothetical protein